MQKYKLDNVDTKSTAWWFAYLLTILQKNYQCQFTRVKVLINTPNVQISRSTRCTLQPAASTICTINTQHILTQTVLIMKTGRQYMTAKWRWTKCKQLNVTKYACNRNKLHVMSPIQQCHHNTTPVTPCSAEHFLKCILTSLLRLHSRSHKPQENCLYSECTGWCCLNSVAV